MTQQLSQVDRSLRHQIRNLQYAAQHDRDDLTKIGNPKLLDILEQAGELQAQVSRPREQALDSELFHNLAECGREMARRLVNGTQSISASDFVRRLQSLFTRNDENCFQSFAVEHHHVIPTTSGICCMLGPLATCPKPKKERTAPNRAPRAPPAPAVIPQEQLEMDEEGRQDTDKHIADMWRTINHLDRQGTSVFFAPLILSHDSFAHTVENVFALSFLVRDGRVRYKKTPQGLQVVPVGKGQGAGTCTAHLERRQFIMTITFGEWESMCKAVPRDKCLSQGRPVPAQTGPCRPLAASNRPLAAAPGPVVKQEGGGMGPVVKQEGGGVRSGKRGKRRSPMVGSKENMAPTGKRMARGGG